MAGLLPRRVIHLLSQASNSISDADDAEVGTLYFFSSKITNMPISTAYLLVFGAGSDWRIQLAVGEEVYLRRYCYGKWEVWIKL